MGLEKAVRSNRVFASRLDWPSRFHQITSLLGFSTAGLSEEEFATAIEAWQARNPPLTPDGILGPNTWRHLKPLTNFTAPQTPRPEWVRNEQNTAHNRRHVVQRLIEAWKAYALKEYGRRPDNPISEQQRYIIIAGNLYEVRNPDFIAPAWYSRFTRALIGVGYGGHGHKTRSLSYWPRQLLSDDDEVIAAVEHYFLCRSQVGSGVRSARQMIVERDLYEQGKRTEIPIVLELMRHNPNSPVTPLSQLQQEFQDLGIRHGEADLQRFGNTAPLITWPLVY